MTISRNDLSLVTSFFGRVSTDFDKVAQTAGRISRAALAVFIDLALLPAAGILLLYMLAKPNFDPAEPKKDAVPILLLHGSGFNESEWIFGRQFLKKEQYGSVFSLNYAGLVSNEPTKGIDDYAADKVRAKIRQIKELTGQNRIILIGHSMGGLIAGHYAERLAAEDEMQVDHVMSIGSPWKGSPVIDRFIAGPNAPKRYSQMSSSNQFRQELVTAALQSERQNLRKYYSVGSEMDFLVPGAVSNLTEAPERQKMVSYLGHYGIIASVSVWRQIRLWLDEAYATN